MCGYAHEGVSKRFIKLCCQNKEKKMANKKISVIFAGILVGAVLGSCASYSTVNGLATPLGVLTAADEIHLPEDEVIASYTLILGVFTVGYKDFLQKVGETDVDIRGDGYLGIYTTFKAVKRKSQAAFPNEK
jgi:hypothetical protein